MENSTSLTFLDFKTSSMADFENLFAITSYPELFSAPEKRDISDLSSNQKKYDKGMIDLPDYAFEFIYTKEKYHKAKALESDDTVMYRLRFGENGEYGMWQWTAGMFVTPSGGSVGDNRTGTITLYPSTEVEEVGATTIYIGSIRDQSVVVGTNKTIPINCSPNDATLTAVSSTTAKATVAINASTNMLTITPVAAGTTVVTVTGAKSGYTSGTETFTVTVEAAS